jgi:predicted  nucleic acid-binding Zn-ribbon protein
VIRIYILLFIVTTVLTLGYGGYRYVTQLQQQVITLRENNVLLEQTVATNQATINRMAAEAVRNAELQSQLQGRLQAAEQRVNSLRTRLSQIDITREALSDPVDMEARINRGVQRLIERILEDTGGEVVRDTSSPASTQ